MMTLGEINSKWLGIPFLEFDFIIVFIVSFNNEVFHEFSLFSSFICQCHLCFNIGKIFLSHIFWKNNLISMSSSYNSFSFSEEFFSFI